MSTDPEAVHADPGVLGGTPVFIGTRVPVKSLFHHLEAGDTLGEFLQQFPSVKREHAVAALELACERLLSGAPLASGSPRIEDFPGISIDPDVRSGKPCLVATRIDVATIVGAVAADEAVEAVAEQYALTNEQVRCALSYAAHVAAQHDPAAAEHGQKHCGR